MRTRSGPSPSCDRRCPRHRRAGRSIGLVPTMGAFHAGHLSLDAPGPRRMRRRRRLAVRQPDAVQRRGRPRPRIRATRPRDAALAERDRRRHPVRAAGRGGLPARLRDDRVRCRAHRHARGRVPRPRALRRRHHRRHEDVQHGRARRRVLRAEGRPAGGRRPARSCATSTCRSGSRSATPCASRMGWRCRAATFTSAPRSASAPPRSAARSTRSMPPSPRGSTTPARSAPALRPSCATRGIEPEYLVLVSPETLAPVQRVDGEVLALVAARVGTTRLIDNHRLMPARVTAGATDARRQ